MSKQSLSERILAYYQNHSGEWIASGDIQRIVTEKTKYTASNATRRLRELAEDGLLEVEYRKGHAFYRAVQTGPVKKKVIQMVTGPDGVPVAKEVEVEINN